ncbi:hypothetical protein HPB47_006603 [Ixodes persulcatus]|uniref:Uncharacterized protein n=1 Tax=Ixodes persulcatus TaxID=34615 RepID=A0AC60P9W7_IXOPE|nr:hypothetical protein HPB47_006603 [Ixodes persulcatus]
MKRAKVTGLGVSGSRFMLVILIRRVGQFLRVGPVVIRHIDNCAGFICLVFFIISVGYVAISQRGKHYIRIFETRPSLA